MLREHLVHGFKQPVWDESTEQACAAMIEAASRRGMITYSDLVSRISTIQLEPHDVRLAHMLGEISSSEYKAGRGMLTVVVVHKVGDMEPGAGFYELARSLGQRVGNKQEFWVNELHRVHDYWSNRSS